MLDVLRSLRRCREPRAREILGQSKPRLALVTHLRYGHFINIPPPRRNRAHRPSPTPTPPPQPHTSIVYIPFPLMMRIFSSVAGLRMSTIAEAVARGTTTPVTRNSISHSRASPHPRQKLPIAILPDFSSVRGLQLCATWARRCRRPPTFLGPNADSGSAVDRGIAPPGHGLLVARSLDRADGHPPSVRRVFHLSRTIFASFPQKAIPASPCPKDRTGFPNASLAPDVTSPAARNAARDGNACRAP